jgi:Zn-dependent protease
MRSPLRFRTYRVAGLSWSAIEVRDLAKAWAAVSIAFAIVLVGFSLSLKFLLGIALAAFTVGTAFLLHELGHKLVAQRYGCFAEFRSFDQMLLLCVLMSFFGFIFAAPGAVMIAGHVTRERNGKISAAGPLVNIILALLFLLAYAAMPSLVFRYGVMINAWIAMFNMIPFWQFDGAKIWAWSKGVWLSMLGMGIGLLVVSF